MSVPPLTSLHAAGHQHLGQRFGIVHDLPDVLLVARRQRLAKADRLAGDDVHQRPALNARKHGPIDFLGIGLLAEDHAAARSAERLVRGRGDEIGHRHGMSCSLAATSPA